MSSYAQIIKSHAWRLSPYAKPRYQLDSHQVGGVVTSMRVTFRLRSRLLTVPYGQKGSVTERCHYLARVNRPVTRSATRDLGSDGADSCRPPAGRVTGRPPAK